MAVPAVPLSGKLEEHTLPAVMRSLSRERRDGCLTVSRGAITRRLYLRGGMIVYGSSTEPADRLGEILIAQGKLTRADHKKYWEQSQAGNRLLGITLVLNGRITLHDLYQGVTAQVVTILDRLQKWRKGDYEFVEGREPEAGTVLLRIPLALYLKADAEKKPAEKKPAARGAAKKKGEAGAGRAGAGKTAAGKAAAVPAARKPAQDADEEVPVIEVAEDEAGAKTAISAEAAEELERVGEVSFMVQELRKRIGQDPFSLLGVPAAAERAVVQAAFHRIAKVLHPDRLPQGIAPELAREAEEIFRDVTAASEATEEEQRRTAAAAPAPAPEAQRARAPISDDDLARRFFAQGREWIAKRNYWQAADALRQAVRLVPSEPMYRQYLGLSLMQTKRLHEAEEHLVEATHLEPHNDAHFVNLGRIYRAGRLYRKAREAFEKALRIEPRNEHARDELRDLPEEPQPGRKPESGGLLKKIFGKG
jgi:Flp pilus assembly protein TadD